MTEIFAQPDDFGDIRASELHTSLGESLGAQAGEAFFGGTRTFYRIGQYNTAEAAAKPDLDPFSARMYHGVGHPDVAPAELPIEDARKRVKDEGLEAHLKLPDQPTIRQPVLDLMVAHAHERRDYDNAVSRGPQGFFPGALGFVTQIGAGIVDPVNIAAFSVPVVGEARAGAMMARAGESLLARAGARAGVGAAQGAVGSAALQPADWWLHTKDGQDYTMADALKSIALGAGMGGVAHAGLGVVGDLRARLHGMPLPGSPQDLVLRGLMAGRHVRGEPATEGAPIGGVLDELHPAGFEGLPLERAFPEDIFADLPPPVREDLVRTAAADIIADRPGRAGDVLAIAADHDPRIAESTGGVEAYHGSPHDFDRFDIGRIGQGEGAQAYGHGLYVAEQEAVARKYSKSTSYRDFMRKVQELYDQFDSPDDARAALDESKDFTPGQKRLLAALEKDDWLGFDYPHQAVSAAIREPGSFDLSPETHAALSDLGNLYKVRINADHEHFLDWDKPLSEQSERVQAALKGLGIEGDPTGKEIYQSLIKYRPDSGGGMTSAGMKLSDLDKTPEAASRTLHVAGIRGIKYLDQGSRGAGDGTRNFVVFRDADIEITHKNGEPARQADLPPRLHGLSADAREWPKLPDGAQLAGAGNHGPVIEGLQGRWQEALAWLREAQTGDARGVLEHPDAPGGRIDVIWGEQNPATGRGYGLAHIIALHPEVIPDLPERLARMRVVRSVQRGHAERVVLSSPDGAEGAVIRTGFEDEPKVWLLTAYSKESDRRGGGTPGSPSDLPGPARSPGPPEETVARPGESLNRAADDFHRLNEPVHDPERAIEIEASKAAEAAPEPASVDPTKAVSEAEKAAAAADELLKDLDLTEAERARIQESLDELAADKASAETILRDGAACLIAAVA